MGKLKNQWEKDLLNAPLSLESSNKEWMELVEQRIVKKKSRFKPYLPLVGSLAVIVLALTVFATNEDYFRSLKPFNSNASSEKFQVVEGLTMEEDAQIKISRKADLIGSMKDATVALIHLPLKSGEDYTGYLGVWDSNGKLFQKFAVNGYNLMNPVQIHVQDITGDGNLDIVLETDEGANGGFGAHALHIYVEEKGQYVEAPLSEGVDETFTATYRSSSNDFIMSSTPDNRRWTVKMTEDQLKQLLPNLLNQSNPVHVDPLSAIDLQNNSLKTKRLLWFGNLQLNSLAVLETSYYFEDDKWAVQSYDLVDVDKSTVVNEIK